MSDEEDRLTPQSMSRRKLLQFGAMTALFSIPLSTTFASPNEVAEVEGDLAILNVALGLEHQAIAAYQAGVESHLLTGDILNMAVNSQRDHKNHRD